MTNDDVHALVEYLDQFDVEERGEAAEWLLLRAAPTYGSLGVRRIIHEHAMQATRHQWHPTEPCFPGCPAWASGR